MQKPKSDIFRAQNNQRKNDGRATAIRADIPEMTDARFFAVIESRLSGLLALGRHLRKNPKQELTITRPLLAMIQSRSEQLEELLDAFGAKNNSRWFVFRELMGAAKAFSILGYKLLHIHHSQKTYRLLEINDDFDGDTLTAIEFVTKNIRGILLCLVDRAEDLNLNHSHGMMDPGKLTEALPSGRLPDDREPRHVESATDTVVHICTSFLELAAQSDLLKSPKDNDAINLEQLIPEPIGEESLRQLEYRFHSFQSLYDTYVWDTDTERTAPSLPILRGHISIIFHLLETATILAHFYERHLASKHPFRKTLKSGCPIKENELLHILFNYSINYAERYVEGARQLCRQVLRQFLQPSSIELPIPNYRGFHVRPSTLLARIVHHYGSEVVMDLLGSEYNVAEPLDLFRANEAVNALKRRRIGDLTAELEMPESLPAEDALPHFVRHTVLKLAEHGHLVIYEQPLPVDRGHLKRLSLQNPNPLEFIKEEIRRLLALGKIDIDLELTAVFKGDRRVLQDIKALADTGYGEDRFGNNIPLPPALNYIKRH